MIESGILTDEDRVLLWKGVLLEKMTKARPHTVAVMRLTRALGTVVGAHSAYVEKEEAVRLLHRNDTIPEPDAKMVRGRLEDYSDIPTTRDVPLIVEVADTSLAFDMGPKQRLHAVESVPEDWVVNVNERWVELFTQPSGPESPTGYQQRATYRAGALVPVRLDGDLVGHVPVDEIFA
jgi:hypothetical protein